MECKMEVSSDVEGEPSESEKRVKEEAESEADSTARLNAEKTVEEIKKDMEILAKLNAELHIKLTKAENANKELEGKVKSINEKNGELEKIIQEKDEEMVRLSESKRKAYEDLLEESNRVVTLRANVLRFKKEGEVDARAVAVMKKIIEEKEKEEKTMEEEVKSLIKSNDELKKIIQKKDEEMAKLRESQEKTCKDRGEVKSGCTQSVKEELITKSEDSVMKEVKSLRELNDELRAELRCKEMEMGREIRQLTELKRKAYQDLYEESNRVRSLQEIIHNNEVQKVAEATAFADLEKIIPQKLARLSDSHEKTSKELDAANKRVALLEIALKNKDEPTKVENGEMQGAERDSEMNGELKKISKEQADYLLAVSLAAEDVVGSQIIAEERMEEDRSLKRGIDQPTRDASVAKKRRL